VCFLIGYSADSTSGPKKWLKKPVFCQFQADFGVVYPKKAKKT